MRGYRRGQLGDYGGRTRLGPRLRRDDVRLRLAARSRRSQLKPGRITIDGTAQVRETLVAAISEIAEDDGLTNGSFNHRWLADDPSEQQE